MIKISQNSQLNLQKLIATRMLINANSGGGKSWAIRRILEQSHGQIQQVVIDLEGEFSTLRERFDYLLVGKGGEVPASIRTAELLARRLLEINVSTIIDLSELKHPERITFVRRFLDSLINSPQELWHPVLVIVDEAHQFCPEKAKSEAASAVIDLMTRGRKRGFCGILATQRISKLSKDAAAEANNYLIGRTGLDVDMKRASEILGFVSKDDMRSLRDLAAGEFYIFGSAFKHNGIIKTKIGDVQTTHPDRTRGINIKNPAKTPANIKKFLKDLEDLPQEAMNEFKTIEDHKKQITALKRELTLAKINNPVKIDEKSIERAKEQGIVLGLKQSQNHIGELTKMVKVLENKLADIGKILGKELPKISLHNLDTNHNFKTSDHINNHIHAKREPIHNNEISHNFEISHTLPYDQLPLRAGAMKILNYLAGANNLTKQRLATMSGFSINGGTFNTYVSQLKRRGWITGDNDLTITEDGLKNSQPIEIPSGSELLHFWQNKFRHGAAKILQFIYDQYPNEVSKFDIGEATGYECTGGTFNTYLSELKRNNLIEINGDLVKIANEFFE